VSITDVADFSKGLEETCKNVSPKGPFADTHVNLCSASLGAKVLFATDEWFATADNLLKDGPPQFDLEAYCIQVR
jgi:allantoicase